MKWFTNSIQRLFSPDTFIWVFPLLLVVPNIVLDITEYSSAWSKAANLLLPFGIYLLVLSLRPRTGLMALLFIPVLVYVCVQLVLLHLYGESIIAVDMLLNLVTTNMNEASELLGSLAWAILLVGIVYIPLLIWAVVLALKGAECSRGRRRKVSFVGEAATGLGLVCVVVASCTGDRAGGNVDIFPANVAVNTVIATQRTFDTRDYYHTSAGFSYNATTTRANDQREIYVLVVGETSRADNWTMFGYERPTNPRLSRRSDILKYPKTLTETNITYKSVPMLLSWTTSSNFGDSIYTSKSIIDAFNNAGFNTGYLSNQGRNHSFIDFFARESQFQLFVTDDGRRHYDDELVGPLARFIDESSNSKIFVVLHTYGSHYNYNERYRRSQAVFIPDSDTKPLVENRSQMINAYDNSIIATDAMLDSVIDLLQAQGVPCAMIYVSDHGEDILDDSRERYLHASPVPTYYQLHVPLLIWMSDEFRSKYPKMYARAASHQSMNVSSSRTVFHTMLQIAGVHTRYRSDVESLVSDSYREPARVYMTDHNEEVPLTKGGLRHFDYEQLRLHGIDDGSTANIDCMGSAR